MLRDGLWHDEGLLRATGLALVTIREFATAVPMAPIQIRTVKSDLKHCWPYFGQFPCSVFFFGLLIVYYTGHLIVERQHKYIEIPSLTLVIIQIPHSTFWPVEAQTFFIFSTGEVLIFPRPLLLPSAPPPRLLLSSSSATPLP